jgi:hypothetical protein
VVGLLPTIRALDERVSACQTLVRAHRAAHAKRHASLVAHLRHSAGLAAACRSARDTVAHCERVLAGSVARIAELCAETEALGTWYAHFEAAHADLAVELRRRAEYEAAAAEEAARVAGALEAARAAEISHREIWAQGRTRFLPEALLYRAVMPPMRYVVWALGPEDDDASGSGSGQQQQLQQQLQLQQQQDGQDGQDGQGGNGVDERVQDHPQQPDGQRGPSETQDPPPEGRQ